jgi:hypothetical protein
VIGTILLSKDGKYIDEDGKLPNRPAYDKDMLKALVANQTVSIHGYNMLPPSIRSTCEKSYNYTVPITIKELAKCDMLLVNRSDNTLNGGKVFRLDNFKCIVKEHRIELWVLKGE